MTHADDIRTVDSTGSSSDSKRVRTAVTAHECSPGRTVFTEKGNSEGWIATDMAVELDR